MIKDKHIESWLKNKIITEAQAKKMLADLTEHKQKTTSNKLITIISTIGALLLGIGAVLFIASNWQVIPNIVKVAMLVGSTFATYIVGYLFKYRLQNLPKVGEALLFLGTLLFGATIFIIAQMYHVNTNNHTLILLWFLGILPFLYAFASRTITHLSAFLFFIWIGLFIFQGLGFSNVNLMLLPLVYLVSSVLMFNYGSLHCFYSHFYLIGSVYRLWGINIGMMSLFFLSFKYFSAHADPTFFGFVLRDLAIQSHFTNLFIGSSVLAVIFALILLWRNPSKSKSAYIESCVSIALIISAALCFFILNVTNLYVLMFNALFVLLLMLIIAIGNNNKNMVAINIAMFWTGAFIITHYFDFFWDLLPRSLFFIAGGLVLVIGGIILERKRRNLKLK